MVVLFVDMIVFLWKLRETEDCHKLAAMTAEICTEQALSDLRCVTLIRFKVLRLIHSSSCPVMNDTVFTMSQNKLYSVLM